MSRDAARRIARGRGIVVAALGLVVGSGAPLACASAGGPQSDAARAGRPAPQAGSGSESEPRSEPGWPVARDEVLHAYGQLLGTQLPWLGLDAEEIARLLEGVRSAAEGRIVDRDASELVAAVEAFREARLEAVGRQRREATQPFLDEAAQEPGATRLDSGLVFTTLERGSGDPPRTVDQVHLHFEGTLDDGTPYRSTWDRDEPTPFPVNTTMPCLKEALQRMRPGGRAHLVCPSELVYGDRGRPPHVPGGAALVFELELVRVDRVEDLVAEAEAEKAARLAAECDCESASSASGRTDASEGG